MKVLGIDPGTNLLGMGIIEEDRKGMRCVAAGLLDLRKQDRKKVGQVIYQAISFVIAEYHPDALAIEDQFIGVNPRSGLKVNEAKMAAILAAQMAGIPHYEYAPAAVKKSACGCGNADKEYVAKVVCGILKLADRPKYFDVTDALAVAICHLNKARVPQIIGGKADGV